MPKSDFVTPGRSDIWPSSLGAGTDTDAPDMDPVDDTGVRVVIDQMGGCAAWAHTAHPTKFQAALTWVQANLRTPAPGSRSRSSLAVMQGDAARSIVSHANANCARQLAIELAKHPAPRPDDYSRAPAPGSYTKPSKAPAYMPAALEMHFLDYCR